MASHSVISNYRSESVPEVGPDSREISQRRSWLASCQKAGKSIEATSSAANSNVGLVQQERVPGSPAPGSLRHNEQSGYCRISAHGEDLAALSGFSRTEVLEQEQIADTSTQVVPGCPQGCLGCDGCLPAYFSGSWSNDFLQPGEQK